MQLQKLNQKPTDREKEIIECMIQGYKNREIARELNLSEGTVRNYISRMLLKYECKDRTQLAVFMITKGLK